MSKPRSNVGKICAAIAGTAHCGGSDYFAAKSARDALRCKSPIDKLNGVRRALKGHAVTVWLVSDAIEIRRDAKPVLSLPIYP
jgi:hypothetical protein